MKKFVGIIALVMALALVFVSCGDDEETADITYTVKADGSVSATSTKIDFTFKEDVSGLKAADITITAGTGKATAVELKGSAKSWSLAISDVGAGKIKVSIKKAGIESKAKDVDVFGFTYYFNPGKLYFYFDEMTPAVVPVAGKNYDVILSITALDDELVDGHFGGMLVYLDPAEEDPEEARTELAAWQNGSPQDIVEGPQVYKWRFMNVGAVPADARLYFELVAKKTWTADFTEGKRGMNATIAVTEFIEPVVEKKFEITDTSTSWDWFDTTSGNPRNSLKGKLTAALSAEIMALTDGLVKIFYEGVKGTDFTSAGDGIGSLGGKGFNVKWWDVSASPGGDNYIADGTTISEVITIYVEDMVLESDNTLLLNVYNGAKVTKLEVWGLPD